MKLFIAYAKGEGKHIPAARKILIKKIKINLENFVLKIKLMFAFKKQNGEKRKYF